MPESGETEGEPLTVDQVIEAVHKTGFRIVADDKGGVSLRRPDNQAHVPGSIMSELKRVRQEIIEKWERCEKCKCGYLFIHRLDVGKLCDKGGCPLRNKQ